MLHYRNPNSYETLTRIEEKAEPIRSCPYLPSQLATDDGRRSFSTFHALSLEDSPPFYLKPDQNSHVSSCMSSTALSSLSLESRFRYSVAAVATLLSPSNSIFSHQVIGGLDAFVNNPNNMHRCANGSNLARKMSPVADSTLLDGGFATAVNHLLHHHFPESIEKIVFPARYYHEDGERKVNDGAPVDIVETAKEYVFYLDVPGLSKTDIQSLNAGLALALALQVTVEDENTLVMRGGGKRKREDGEDEGCKYIRLERTATPKFLRKFRLPDTCNTSSISAKCENGVLTVTVEKLPPPPKSKTVQVKIS
ncbi:hypothetical protein ACLOJK_000963 [Asimina triloba]